MATKEVTNTERLNDPVHQKIVYPERDVQRKEFCGKWPRFRVIRKILGKHLNFKLFVF